MAKSAIFDFEPGAFSHSATLPFTRFISQSAIFANCTFELFHMLSMLFG